jgi:hypothetical protein
MKIVIVVQGGCVQSVFCDVWDAEVQLLDFDNTEEEDGHLPPGEGTATKEIDHELGIAEQTMHEILF